MKYMAELKELSAGATELKTAAPIRPQNSLAPRPDGHYARHWDDDKTNNHVSNLSWGSPSENNYDKVRNGNDHYAKRDSCVNGHEFTPDNIARNPKYPGTRYCKACAREAQARYGDRREYKRKWRAKRRAAGKPVT